MAEWVRVSTPAGHFTVTRTVFERSSGWRELTSDALDARDSTRHPGRGRGQDRAVAACVLSDSPRTGFAFLFLWVTPYAVYFGLRHAVLQTGRSGEAYTQVPTRRSARVAATASVGPGAGCHCGTSGISSVE